MLYCTILYYIVYYIMYCYSVLSGVTLPVCIYCTVLCYEVYTTSVYCICSHMCVTIQVCIYCTLQCYEVLQTSVYTLLCSVTLPVCINKLLNFNISDYKSSYVGVNFNCYVISSCLELLDTTSVSNIYKLHDAGVSGYNKVSKQ